MVILTIIFVVCVQIMDISYLIGRTSADRKESHCDIFGGVCVIKPIRILTSLLQEKDKKKAVARKKICQVLQKIFFACKIGTHVLKSLIRCKETKLQDCSANNTIIYMNTLPSFDFTLHNFLNFVWTPSFTKNKTTFPQTTSQR